MNVIYNGNRFPVEILEVTEEDSSILFGITALDGDRSIYRIKEGYSKPVDPQGCNTKRLPKELITLALSELGLLQPGEIFKFSNYNGDIVKFTRGNKGNSQGVASETVIIPTIEMVSVVDNNTGAVAMFSSYEDAIVYSVGKTVTINKTHVPMTNATPVVKTDNINNSTPKTTKPKPQRTSTKDYVNPENNITEDKPKRPSRR